jgi:VWFA-related protein
MSVRNKLVSFAVLCLALAVISGPVLAQEGSSVQINALDDGDFPTLTVVASVLDANGRPVTGLTAEDFDVLEDGAPANLLDVQPVVNADFGIAVVIAIDVSTSMNGAPLTATKQAATAFIDTLGEADQVAVLTFGNTVQVVQNFTTDKAAARSAVESLRAGGRTALYDGAFHAVQLASEANLPRRVVVLLSDANEYGGLSMARRGDAFLAANDAGIPVYTIALGSAVDQAYMEELATLTGGETYHAPKTTELAAAYSDLADLLHNQYALRVASGVLGDDQQHALTVRLRSTGAEASRTFQSRAVAPQVTVSGLAPGQTLAERTTLTLDIASQGAIGSVSYTVDGQPVSSEAQSPYSLILDPHSLTPGLHGLTVEVRDAVGNVGQSQVPFDVPALPPTVDLPILVGAETISEAIALEPELVSQSPVRQVTYTIDGSPVHTTSQAPYNYTLNPADLRPGEHTLAVTVEDENGQLATSEFGFSVGRAPVNLLLLGGGAAVLALFTLMALVLAGVVLALRRRPTTVTAPAPPPVLVVSEEEAEPTAWLKIDAGGNQRGETLPLKRKRVVIGRSPRCDFVLNDMQRFTSREHAVVWWQDARYMIEDLNSTRGTYVNGRRLEGRHRLANGDEIRMGSYILFFQELIYDEDMEATMIVPGEDFAQASTQITIGTDALKEKERRERRRQSKSDTETEVES